MPPRKSSQLAQNEGRIALAIQAYQRGQFSSLTAATTAYDVPHSTVYDRIRGRVARSNTRPKSCKLTQNEEASLEQWIISMDERGLPLRIDTVRQMANLLLQKRVENQVTGQVTDSPDLTDLQVGKNWVRNFVQRHNTLQSRFTRKYDYQRAKCEDPTIIRNWFRLIQNVRAKYGITDEDIYNFDETGFQMGVISTARVICGSEKAKPICVQPGNREWVTIIECIRTDRWSLPAMVIFKGKQHPTTWYSSQLPPDWAIGVSENGWTTDILGLTWLTDIFEKHTKDRIVGKYRLLIFDGHGSHSTPEFDLFCTEHSIITLCIPPHSSHLLQPLDVGCFAAVKRSYGRQIELRMRAGLNHIDKPDFLQAYYETQKETLILGHIQSGFAGTGLIPYDPDRVLKKLHVTLRTPTPPLIQSSSPWAPETPHNLRELDRQAKTIKGYIRRRTQSPPSPTDLALNQLVKGCQMAMHSAILLTEENRRLRSENERQKKKRAKRKAYVATGGVLTVQEGLNRSQLVNIKLTDEVTDQPTELRIRAPNKCSMCKSLKHTARTCPTRYNSN